MKLLFIALMLLSVSFNSFSQSSEYKTVKQNTIENLKWLSGYWTTENSGTKMEEFWLPVSNGIMLGLHRDSFSSGKTFFEFLRIEQSDEKIVYYASPRGKQQTKFTLKTSKEKSVIFENINHNFPQRIIYSLDVDTLFVRIEGTVSGELKYKE